MWDFRVESEFEGGWLVGWLVGLCIGEIFFGVWVG